MRPNILVLITIILLLVSVAGMTTPQVQPNQEEFAPVIKLTSVDGKSDFDTQDYRGRKPVALFFGCYT